MRYGARQHPLTCRGLVTMSFGGEGWAVDPRCGAHARQLSISRTKGAPDEELKDKKDEPPSSIVHTRNLQESAPKRDCNVRDE